MKKLSVVILHGWNLSSEKFNPLVKELEKNGYNVYCPDLPGFGRSKMPDHPLVLSDYADFLEKYRLQKKLDKFVLIGHSFGGRIGIKYSVYHSDKIYALILTGAPGIPPVSRGKIYFFLLAAKAGNLFFSIPPMNLFKGTARKMLYRIAHSTDFYNTDKNLRETFKNVVKENLTDSLPKIKVPVLLIWGKNDGIVPLDIANKMNNLIKNSKIEVIDNSKHAVPWTHSEEFTRKMNKFLMDI